MAEPLRNLSHSRLKAVRQCQRLHLYEYELGYQPLTADEVLRFGSLFHRGLEAWWKARKEMRDDPLAEGLAAMAGEADPFDRVRAEELLRAYDLRWADQPYEVLAVEQRFETSLVNPATGAASKTWQLVGVLDVVVRDLRDERVLVMEHKTSGEDISPGAKYWQRLRMDGQVSVYFEGGRALGYDVSAVLYDVIAKPGIRPLKATPLESRKYKKDGELYANQRASDETPDEFRVRLVEDIAKDPNAYFGRAEVVRLEHELDEARFDIWQLGQQIRESERLNRAPRNPDACERYGRVCPFFDVCTGQASLEDPARFRRTTQQGPKEEAAA